MKDDKFRKDEFRSDKGYVKPITDDVYCDLITMEDLDRKKSEMDRMYQEKIDTLNREKMDKHQLYQNRIEEARMMKQEEQQLNQKRVQEILDEQALQEKLFHDKLEQLKAEKTELDRMYQNKVNEVRTSTQKTTGVDEKINQIQKEKMIESELIQDKINQVEEEKRKQDELYRLSQEKLRLEEQQREKINEIKSEKLEQDRMHQERQDRLRMERSEQQERVDRTEIRREETTSRSDEKVERNRDRDFVGGTTAGASSAPVSSSDDTKRLCRLGEMSDYEVADEDPDIRGWDVLGENGEKIGTVEELIVDTTSMKVRYLDIDLDDSIIEGNEERHVLIPIGAAKLDDDDDNVFVQGLDRKVVNRFPAYKDRQPLTREYENEVRSTLSPGYNTSGTTGNFYEHDHFDDKRFYGSRRNKRK
jgi:photosynthetic reaction center H subunit